MNEIEQKCIIKTRQHMVLFSILLGDFLSQFTASKVSPSQSGRRPRYQPGRPS